MSGHSKWAKIHRQKGLIDQQRGKVFQRIAKEIYIAAKGTNGKIEDNPSLRLVVDKAKALNMPKDNIEKAINKAIGAGDTEQLEEIMYEGYGSGGVAIMVYCLTDNKNRSAMLVRSTFTKHGGNLGTSGSVSYLFKRKGVIEFSKELMDYEKMLETALMAGALDTASTEENYIIYTEPEDLNTVKEAFVAEGINSFEKLDVEFVPDTTIEGDDEFYEKNGKLIEALEDIDDVQSIYHNLA